MTPEGFKIPKYRLAFTMSLGATLFKLCRQISNQFYDDGVVNSDCSTVLTCYEKYIS